MESLYIAKAKTAAAVPASAARDTHVDAAPLDVEVHAVDAATVLQLLVAQTASFRYTDGMLAIVAAVLAVFGTNERITVPTLCPWHGVEALAGRTSLELHAKPYDKHTPVKALA